MAALRCSAGRSESGDGCCCCCRGAAAGTPPPPLTPTPAPAAAAAASAASAAAPATCPSTQGCRASSATVARLAGSFSSAASTNDLNPGDTHSGNEGAAPLAAAIVSSLVARPNGARPAANSYANTPTAHASTAGPYHKSERSLWSSGPRLSGHTSTSGAI